ncbi:MAG TPA: cofactor-independent phosphoglycerate mutase [Phycisphaerales bacterium]|nr:cofactor-independent phosphoglycerate mutase [Phycisphaerales bacterium]
MGASRPRGILDPHSAPRILHSLKYAIIIADGAADLPVPALGGRTPLEAARTPSLDALARRGTQGVAVTTPPGFGAGSDVCSMSLLGYDPARFHTGRAPLEAAALGLEPGPDDWVFRLNLVTTDEGGRMLDHSAGAISDAEARPLVADLAAAWSERCPEISRGLSLTPGVSYRNILVDASGRDYAGVRTTPPHEIPGEPFAPHQPTGGDAAAALVALMRVSAEVFRAHPVNAARRRAGKRPATMAWIWGQGRRPAMPRFADTFGLRGSMITAVDLLAGIAALAGWDRPVVPGITSYHDTDYAAQGRATADALDHCDIACCHVESPDEASHQGDVRTKVAALEAIDAHVVPAVLARLESFPRWRLLVMPDHYTLVSTRKHDATPPPWLMAGTGISPSGAPRWTEPEARRSGVVIDPGHTLMGLFLARGPGTANA